MNEPTELLDVSLLPYQYDDLIRRSTLLSGENRLLWAVLEDAMRTYLANAECRTRSQRIAFEEVRDWFASRPGTSTGLYSFETVCDLLGIDCDRLLTGLRSMQFHDLPARRHRGTPRGIKMQHLAA